MADLTRAEELVQAMERDAAFRSEVEAAPTAAAKRHLIDARGFTDVSLDDMRAFVESKGGKLVILPGGRELSDEELAAVAGGEWDATWEAKAVLGITVGISVGIGAASAAAA